MWHHLCLLFLCIHICEPILYIETDDTSYKIAGIFEGNTQTARAFNESVHHVHSDQGRLAPILLTSQMTNSYSTWRELCSNKELRPIAVVGPQSPVADGAVRDQCALANVPHIQATWKPLDPDLEMTDEEEEEEEEEEDQDKESNETLSFKKISINFYPDSDEISLAYAKLLKYYNWETFSALYEDDFGLLRIQKILAEHSTQYPIHLRKLNPETDNRNVFKDLQKYQDSSRLIIDCSADRILKYMEELNGLGMLNNYQHYILVNLDASIVAETLVTYPSNITWLSLTEYDKLIDAKNYLAPRVDNWKVDQTSKSLPVSSFSLETLLMDDIANHVIRAIDYLAKDSDEENSDDEKFREPESSICDQEADPWAFGARFQKAILETNTFGITGRIQFDDRGRRANYTLFVNEIHYVNKRQTVGRWESANATEIIDERPKVSTTSIQQSSKHFIVISRMAKPYFHPVEPCEEEDEECIKERGDKKFEGFSVDLVEAIFEILRQENYSYTYEFKDLDLKYGTYDPQIKKWNGLIGELLDKKADLAVCDLTITEERKKVVDFSVPFMSLGISILYTKEQAVPPAMFSFLNPYTFDVWLHTATAYCVVSIVLFICARISPADWENPQPCDKDPEELENIWNFKNCAWLTMGSIMTQGCDILPKAIGTRWVCGMWWFFAVIVCQTYIAQLSASMTSALENEPINSVEDLAKQTKILYGAIEGGSTYEFFKSSKDKMYQKIFETMQTNPSLLVSSNDIGEKRVLSSKNKYAFFMESTSIEYKQKRNCDLQKVGGELDSKDYGIAMPANSPFRSQINRAILKLKELTKLENIKTKWWDQKYGAKTCEDKTDESDIEGDLELENLIGAFVVLAAGLFLCIFVTAAEFMNEIRNIVVREEVTHKEAIIQELKASLNFFQLQKPVLRNPSRAPSLAPSISPSENESEKNDQRAALIDNFLQFEKEAQKL